MRNLAIVFGLVGTVVCFDGTAVVQARKDGSGPTVGRITNVNANSNGGPTHKDWVRTAPKSGVNSAGAPSKSGGMRH